MTNTEETLMRSTLQLLIAQQREEFSLFRAAVINYLMTQLDNNCNLLKRGEL